MSSVYNSVSHALHTLRNPHLAGRLTACRHARKKDQEGGYTDMAFDSELRGRLTQLNGSIGEGFLTLPWLCDAIKVVLDTFSQISNVLPRITSSEKEKILFEANLEDTLILLDVCNGLKEVLNDVQHYVMLVRYAVRSATDVKDDSDEEFASRLLCLHTALGKAADFMQAKVEENGRHRAGKSKLDTCSSMLRRMGEPHTEASPGRKRAASNAFFNELYAAKVLAIFMCSVLAITLTVKPKRKLSCVHMEAQPTWLDLLQQIQDTVKKLTDSGIEHEKVALLKELDEVRMHSEELREMLEDIVMRGMPLVNMDKSSLSQQCEKLVKDSDGLQKGLLALQKNLDSFFRMLITIRVDFLDVLCHT